MRGRFRRLLSKGSKMNFNKLYSNKYIFSLFITGLIFLLMWFAFPKYEFVNDQGAIIIRGNKISGDIQKFDGNEMLTSKGGRRLIDDLQLLKK